MKEAAADLNVRQIANVARNELGTPLVNSIFNLAREAASHEILIYLNADIILLPDCLRVVDEIFELKKEFLLVGRRWEMDITREIDFANKWLADIEEKLSKFEGRFSETAMDYFIFPRHLFTDIPSFAIGRAGWDNWMIYHAVQQPWPVIDITPVHKVIHQRHDYRHLPEGEAHFDLEESYQNVSLAGGIRTAYDLLDVPFIFQNGRISRKFMTLTKVLRILERLVIPDEQKGWRWQFTRVLRKVRKKISKIRRSK